jgi:uncharacterized membrane protein YebE (DUF533 family)
MDPERVLDALVAGSTSPSSKPQDGAQQLNFIEELLGAFTSTSDERRDVLQALPEGEGQPVGGTVWQLALDVRSKLGRPPGPSRSALLSITGLLLQPRRRAGLMRALAGLGGHVVVSGVVLRGSRLYCRDMPSGQLRLHISEMEFMPARATPADSFLFDRAMIAAIVIARCLRDYDTPSIVEGFKQCGLSSDETDWLLGEFGKPATIDELTADGLSFAKAARVYAAVRVVIERDGPEAVKFTDQLVDALRLDPLFREALDTAATTLKSSISVGD